MKDYFSIFGEIRKNNKNYNGEVYLEKNENKGIIYSDDKHKLSLNSNGRFEEDSVLEKNERFILLVDGVLLNYAELKTKNKVDTYLELCCAMYNKKGLEFFKEFKGNFSGYFYDIELETGVLFTNQYGDKRVYYYEDEEMIVFGSRVQDVANYISSKNIELKLDLGGAYSLLTYGFMYHNLTLVRDIRKLLAGHCLKILPDSKIVTNSYYELPSELSLNIDIDTATKELHQLFMQATQLQLNKNIEYGFQDWCPLSAGLDSRITTFAVSEINNKQQKDVYNMTYSESGELDQAIPTKISKDIKSHFLFKAQDNGLFLKNIDYSTTVSDGVQFYVWPAQLLDYLSLINYSEFGLVHTGVLGDAIVGGSFLDQTERTYYEFGDGAYSLKLINKAREAIEQTNYPNREIGMMMNRGYNGATLGYSTAFQMTTEAFSPFMDVDFLNYCLKLPYEYRKGYKIYFKWIREYFPKACKYKYNGLKIPKNTNLTINWKKRRWPIGMIPSLLSIKFKTLTKKTKGMNPFDLWYKTNMDIKESINSYFEENIDLLRHYGDLFDDTRYLFLEGNTLEKTLTLSLLASVKFLLC